MTEKCVTYLAPARRGDPMGDRWAAQVRDLYSRTLAKLGWSEHGEGMGAVWCLFQWMYCELADMPSRVVASPQAMIAAGWNLNENIIAKASVALDASSTILEEENERKEVNTCSA